MAHSPVEGETWAPGTTAKLWTNYDTHQESSKEGGVALP